MGLSKPKNKKNRIIFFSVLGIFFIATLATIITLILLSRVDYKIVDDPTYEINTENTTSTLFLQINYGTIENGDDILDTADVGEKTKEVIFANQLGTKKTFSVTYNVVDTTPPTIIGDDELSFESGTEFNLLEFYQAEDNSTQEVEFLINGEYNPNEVGEYIVDIVAKDESGNESTKQIILKITEPPRSAYTDSKPLYYIEVNRQQNVVVVYSKDYSGNYSRVAKVFIASTGAPGSETPLGTYTTSDKYEALYLVGDVWGHYTVRINGPYFFHSVPYFTKGAPDWDNLEYLEYNKLGSGASAGCVRLAAADAKWIYDNIGYGTTVKIYDSDTLPEGITKPSVIKIDGNSPNRGWDPTDPNPNNPWN